MFIENIEKNTLNNINYRNVVHTGKYLQFVYMNIKPNDDIHMEVHDDIDQFIRIEKGNGIAIINDKIYNISDGMGLIIDAGVKHQIINNSNDDLKLYTIYSNPEHKENTIQLKNPDKNNNLNQKKNDSENSININNFNLINMKHKIKYLKYKKKYLNYKKKNIG